MNVRIQGAEGGSPAHAFLFAELETECRRRGIATQREERQVSRTGTLGPEFEVVKVVLQSVTAAVGIATFLYNVVRNHRQKVSPPAAAPGKDVLPVAIRVRFGALLNRAVASEEQAREVDVEIEGLPRDAEVEVTIERS